MELFIKIWSLFRHNKVIRATGSSCNTHPVHSDKLTV